MKRTNLAAAVAALAVTAGALTIVTSNTMPAAAETPAERCERETNDYNRNWENIWRTTHPGDPGPPPPPPVPYQCHDPGPTPTPPTTTTTPPGPFSPTTTAPTTTTTPGPSTSDAPTVDPSGTAPTVPPGPFTLPGQPGPAPQPDEPATGDNPIAGSVCEQALATIGAKLPGVIDLAQQFGFTCSGSEAKLTQAGRTVLGNARTGDARDVTGLGDEQLQQVSDTLQTRGDDDTCSPTTSLEPQNIVVDQYHSRTNMAFCYGQAWTRRGRIVEIEWSNLLRFSYTVSVGQMNNATLSFNALNFSNREGKFTVGWRIQQDKSLQGDPTVDTGTFSSMSWDLGFTGSRLFYLDGPGTYFGEHLTIVVDDLPTATPFSSSQKVQMPRFKCYKTVPCKFG